VQRDERKQKVWHRARVSPQHANFTVPLPHRMPFSFRLPCLQPVKSFAVVKVEKEKNGV
jgi:hypothetical protein